MALLVLYFAPERLRVPENFDTVSERLLVCTFSLHAGLAAHPSIQPADSGAALATALRPWLVAVAGEPCHPGAGLQQGKICETCNTPFLIRVLKRCPRTLQSLQTVPVLPPKRSVVT